MTGGGLGWRRLFLMPVILGTYLWGKYLWEHASQVKTKEYDWAQIIVLMPAAILNRLLANPISTAVLLEFLFLNCFGFLIISILFHRRNGGTGYIAGSFLSSSCLGLGLCNYLYPLTPLERQVVQQMHARHPQGSVKKSEKNQTKREKNEETHTPSYPHALFTLVVFGGLLWADFFWLSKYCMYATPAYLALPLVLLVFLPRRSGDKDHLYGRRVFFLLLAWAVFGCLLAAITRSQESFPVYGLPYSTATTPEGRARLVKKFVSVFKPATAKEDPSSLLHPPTGYLAFAAQLYTFVICVFIFSLLDSTGGVPWLLRVLLIPGYIVAPTAAVPLYFLFRDFTDSDFNSAEAVIAEKVKKAEGEASAKKRN